MGAARHKGLRGFASGRMRIYDIEGINALDFAV
jgi:hypothetical protein